MGFLLVLMLTIVIRVQCSVIPLHYDITIIPELDRLSVISETTIEIFVENEINNITLNTNNLQIGINDLYVVDATRNNVTGVTFAVNGETLLIEFEEPLTEGLYKIVINSTGTIATNLEGLYSSFYNKNNAPRRFLLTNFHYSQVAQVFPCFNDPTLISTFSISLVRPNDYYSLTNQAKTAEVPYDETRTKDSFARIGPIPIYFLSFAIIDFPEVKFEHTTVYTIKGAEAQFLGNLSDRVHQFEPGTIYHLQQIVVPDSALSQEVLENVGLVIYRESAVLYDEERESFEEKQEIAIRVSHAVVKQWYQNVNTSLWWSNFWVAEGVTLSHQYDVLKQLEPSWRIEEQLLVGHLEDTLTYDSDNRLSLLLNEPPNDSFQFFALKAFALVRMFSHLQLPGDILENPNNPTSVAWIQNNVPVLSVVQTSSNLLTFNQGPNFIPIPISIDFVDKTIDFDNFDVTMNSSVLQQEFTSSSSWYIINSNRLGYFRTFYNSENVQSISNFLQTSENAGRISSLNRALLVEDVFDSIRSGRQSSAIYLDLIRYYQNETDYIAISALIRTANELKALLSKSSTQTKFIQFAGNLIAPLYDSVGTSVVDSESHVERLNRIQILTWLCDFDFVRCQEHMHQLLNETTTSVHSDLQEPVYCGGMRRGNISHFGFLKNEYVKYAKKRVLKSLACTSDVSLLRQYIEALLDNTILSLRHEDKLFAFRAILEKSDIGVDVALDYTKQYLEQLLTTFNETEIEEMLLALSEKIVTDEQQSKIDALFACLTDAQRIVFENLYRRVNQTIEANFNWRKTQIDVIDRWLSDPTTSTTTTITTTTPTTTPTTTTPTTTSTTTPAPDAAVSIFNVSFLSLFIYSLLHYFVN